ncbi:MAG: nitronate monooxygenase [Acidimicrobiales bacterium]
MKAIEAGVDGLVVEGGEGGGFKNPDPVASMVLLPLIRSKVDVPIVAAGGIVDGRSMAAACPRRRGRADGDLDGVGGREPGPCQLEAGHRRRRDRHGVPESAPFPALRAIKTDRR